MDSRKYTYDRPVARPATGKTTNRNLRVPDEEWLPALEKARAEGRTLTDVIRAYLRKYNAAPLRKGGTGGKVQP